ncbi:hypothetical protein J3F82_004007 [Coemansia sp. RSA 637]|nr:hypothetical protein J3F82_004007 [Coemansia sp. RSA 637]
MPSAPNGQATRARPKKRSKRRTSNSFKARKQPSEVHETTVSDEPEPETDANGEHMSERCTVHPGSRNEQWCVDCKIAICVHCTSNHPTHIVTKLSAAYDDAFEAIDGMQHTLVEYLRETRQRKTQLEAQEEDVALAYVRAQEALDMQVRSCADIVEARFEVIQQQLRKRIDACADWRAALEDTLHTVQQMVEELPPADMVARRDRVIGLLGAVDGSRPHDWHTQVCADELVELVRPSWMFADIYVPRIMELGRRRGHVRVTGDLFSAHGMVWQAEARRSRGALGDPCLAVTVSCVEGCKTQAFSVSVHLTAQDSTDNERFLQETHSHEWFEKSQYEFSVCSLSELSEACVLDDEGGVVVRFGVRPESFKDLAHVQQDRIRCLEQRVKELEQQKTAVVEPEHTLRRRGSSVTQDRMQASLSRFTFGTDPLPKTRTPSPPMLESPSPPMRESPPLPMLEPPQLERQVDQSPVASALRRRANSSLTLGEQRQQQQQEASPPPPFPIETTRVFENVQASGSQSSVTSSQKSTSNMLRRLSGWVRSTEDRVVQQARRVRQQIGTGARPEGDAIDDWTFLDRSLSPRFPRSETEPISLNVQMARAQASSVQLLQPPPRPLPAVPDALERGRDSADGFAFDGMADIEREQAKVDARMAARKQQPEAAFQVRYDSIVQRIDALQLIANTFENSRDGFTEGTLRRISSELGVLINGRRRHRATEPRAPNPLFAGRRTLSMDPAEMRRGISRATAKIPLSVCVNSVMNNDEDDGLPPSRSTSGEYERTSPGLPPRRNSLGLTSSAVHTPVRANCGLPQQLTPQANRRGGILKPGRTQRSVPARMLPEIAAPGADETLGLISVHTPRGPGRFTEYIADTQSSSPASISPETKTARSATLPNANRVGGVRPEVATPTARDAVVLGRQVRSARASRKHVRFPEEQRLLETIRLIDPRTAKSIKFQVEKDTVDVVEPVRVRSPPPPAFNLNTQTEQSGSGDESDGLPATSSLAARIRSSPRLSAKRPSLDIPKPDTSADKDDVFMDPSSSSPMSSPEQYDTANSQLFSDNEVQRPNSISGPVSTRRAPIPPQLRLGSASTIHTMRMEAGYRHSAAILDYSVMSPTFATHPRSESNSARQSPRMNKPPSDALASSMKGLNISLREVPNWRANINANGQAVGPNVSSPPSSPNLQGPSNCSSPSSADLNLVCGCTDSAHLYPPNIAVFGGEL